MIRHQGNIQILAPVPPGVAAETPWIRLVFKVVERFLHLGRKIRFHEHLVFAGFKDDIQMLDIDRTYILTGSTGGTRPQDIIG